MVLPMVLQVQPQRRGLPGQQGARAAWELPLHRRWVGWHCVVSVRPRSVVICCLLDCSASQVCSLPTSSCQPALPPPAPTCPTLAPPCCSRALPLRHHLPLGQQACQPRCSHPAAHYQQAAGAAGSCSSGRPAGPAGGRGSSGIGGWGGCCPTGCRDGRGRRYGSASRRRS